MKITIIQGAFLPVPPVLGGAVEKRWFAMGKEFVRKGHEVVHISRLYAEMPAEEWIDGVLHKRVRGYGWTSSVLRLWLDFLYALRLGAVVPPDTDIIVTNTFWAPIVLPAALRKKCMVDVARIPKGQMRLYAQAARLRANSNPVAQAIKGELDSDQHHRVVMIPNPLPFHHLPEVDFQAKKKVILYAGRITREKGIELLLKAFKTLEPDWKLKIIGPSDKKEGGGGSAYLESLRRLAGNGRVEFLAPVYDTAQLNSFYAEASIFVYPSVSEKGESFGLAPLEAMAWGCVPVVSRIACFQDFIEHAHNGLVFDHRSDEAVDLLKNALLHLIQDNDYRLKLAQQALNVRKSHSTSGIASDFLGEFACVLDQLRDVKKTIHEDLFAKKSF